MKLKLEYIQDYLRLGIPLKITLKIKVTIIKLIEDENQNKRAKPATLL